MNSELSSAPVPASTLPALPVRRRETLEIFDTSLKLYRRYFWVLLGWSALVSGVSLVPILSYFAFIFALPVLYGAVSCCVAAAVRGQRVKFSQCWAFTKPRYWSLVGTTLLSYLVLFGIYIVLVIAALLIGLLGVWALSSAPRPLQITGIVVGSLLGLVAFSVLMMVAFGWTGMVPIVVCLEDDKRSSAALGRAFDLLKGNWMRVFGLSLILGLAIIAVLIIVGCVYFLIGAGAASSIFSSNPSESALLGLLGTFTAFMGLFALIWNPAQTLIIAVLYLDLRVRREALDLEWTAYASAPVLTPGAAPVDFLAPTASAREETALPVAPASFAAAPSAFATGNVESAPETAPQLVANDFPTTPANNDVPSFARPNASAPNIAAPTSNFTDNSAPTSVFPEAPAPSSSFSGAPAPGSTFSTGVPGSVSPLNPASESAVSSDNSALNPALGSVSESAISTGASDNFTASGTSPGATGTVTDAPGDIAPAPVAAEIEAAGHVFLDKEQAKTTPDSEAKRD